MRAPAASRKPTGSTLTRLRALAVCNFVTVDEPYEDDDCDNPSVFEHQHAEYRGADDVDHHPTRLLREWSTVRGRGPPLGNLGYCASVRDDPGATEIRREFAALSDPVEKIVVFDTISESDIAPYSNTRIVVVRDARAEVTRLKQGDGAGVLIVLGHLLWSKLMLVGLVGLVDRA